MFTIRHILARAAALALISALYVVNFGVPVVGTAAAGNEISTPSAR